MRTREFTTVGKICSREFHDMTNSRARTLELAQITRVRIRDMANSRVCAGASLPLLARIARARFLFKERRTF